MAGIVARVSGDRRLGMDERRLVGLREDDVAGKQILGVRAIALEESGARADDGFSHPTLPPMPSHSTGRNVA